MATLLGVPSPSLFGGTSSVSLVYDKPINDAVENLLLDPRLLLDVVIQREINARQCPFMTLSKFKREYPVGRKIYHCISTLTKIHVFTDRSFKWTPGRSLSAETMALMLNHAYSAVDRMMEAYSTKLASPPDCYEHGLSAANSVLNHGPTRTHRSHGRM